MTTRRFLYTLGGEPLPEPIEVTDDYTGAERRAQTPTEELTYGNVGAATDGTLINTRKRHREYMKEKGLALTSDYTNHWKQAEEKRARAFTDGPDSKTRRESIARALHQQTEGRKRR